MYLQVVNSTQIETSNVDAQGNPTNALQVSFVQYDDKESFEMGIDNGLQTKRLMPLDFATTKLVKGVLEPRTVLGKIQRFETTSYEIAGRSVNHFTLAVFNGENGVELANSRLVRNNACVILNGKPSKEMTKAPVTPKEVLADGDAAVKEDATA
jgi:hypothetical protein